MRSLTIALALLVVTVYGKTVLEFEQKYGEFVKTPKKNYGFKEMIKDEDFGKK